jgi:hypothetical protein
MSKMNTRMISRVVRLAVFSALTACGVGAQHASRLDSFVLPEEAYDVERISDKNSRSVQLFFKVRQSYPSIASSKQIESRLYETGWQVCVSVLTGTEWNVFEDSSDGDVILVHQRTTYWANVKEGAFAQIATTYYSKNINSDTPDNDEQRVNILIQETDNLDPEFSKLRVDCGATHV